MMAAAQGLDEALAELVRSYNMLDAIQIAEAERMAEEWQIQACPEPPR